MVKNTSNIEENLAKIAAKIKQLRKDKGYSSYETFALDHDLDRKQYWRIEKGANVTIATLLKIIVERDRSAFLKFTRGTCDSSYQCLMGVFLGVLWLLNPIENNIHAG